MAFPYISDKYSDTPENIATYNAKTDEVKTPCVLSWTGASKKIEKN